MTKRELVEELERRIQRARGNANSAAAMHFEGGYRRHDGKAEAFAEAIALVEQLEEPTPKPRCQCQCQGES
jgi:hypothetical protein